MTEKFSLKVNMSKLSETSYGTEISKNLRSHGWRGDPISLGQINQVCGPQATMYALGYCGEEGLKVWRLIATDMARVVLDAFERDFQEDERLRRALNMVRAFAEDKEDSKALVCARSIAEEVEKELEKKESGDAATYDALLAARIIVSAADDNSGNAIDNAIVYYIGGDEDALFYPGAMEGLYATLSKFLRRYAAGLDESK